MSGQRFQAGLSIWPCAPGRFAIVIRHAIRTHEVETPAQEANASFLPQGLREDAGARSVPGDATNAAP